MFACVCRRSGYDIHIYRFVIPESPRWLLCKGRVSEVKAIIRAACDFNGHEVPDNMDKLLKPAPQEQTDESCITLFGSKYLRLITICFLCIWFAMNMVYYGLTLNINEFGINVYLISVGAGTSKRGCDEKINNTHYCEPSIQNMVYDRSVFEY